MDPRGRHISPEGAKQLPKRRLVVLRFDPHRLLEHMGGHFTSCMYHQLTPEPHSESELRRRGRDDETDFCSRNILALIEGL